MPRTGRIPAFLLATIVVGGASWWVVASRDPSPVASGLPPTASARAPAGAEQVRAPSVDPAPRVEEGPDSEVARRMLLEADPDLLERGRQLAWAPAADARWSDAVDAGEYAATDLDPAVRELFSTMRLEPHYAEGGAIDGLRIAELADSHPLSRAGFAIGDLLTRIQGVELRDPAELPPLLVRLGPRIEFCQGRSNVERCREVILD